jgi:hypothetical protein
MTGSVFTFHAAPEHLTLSPDARTLHFASPTPPSTPLSLQPLAVGEQALSTGASTLFLTLWGVARLIVGVVVSEDDTDDGDCAQMAAARARCDGAGFEGVEISAADCGALVAHTHRAVFKNEVASASAAAAAAAASAASAAAGAGAAPASAPAAPPAISDGDSLALSLDCDTRRLDVTLLRPARRGLAASSALLASLSALPSRPLRLAVGARGQAGASDLDGVKLSSDLRSRS